MEAPLLPHQHVNKSLNAKIARGLLLKEQQDRDSGNGSITKSMSTPASLQTIVRFQNGSNMSLHHRVRVFIQFVVTHLLSAPMQNTKMLDFVNALKDSS